MKSSRARTSSTLKSFATFAVFLMVASFIISCASSGTSSAEKAPATNADVPNELSLKADRSALDEERKDIPDDKKRDNDELAGILQMVHAKPDQDPSDIRNRFGKAVRDRRDKNDKNLRKAREDYDKNERKTREAFLKTMKTERDKYMGAKHTADERKEFFDSQEDRRKDYFANQSDKRHDFEAKITEERKSFEDYMKEKNDQFTSDMREYTTAYYERKKQEALAKDTAQKVKDRASRAAVEQAQPNERTGQSDELNEFSTIPRGPAIPLGPPGDNR